MNKRTQYLYHDDIQRLISKGKLEIDSELTLVYSEVYDKGKPILPLCPCCGQARNDMHFNRKELQDMLHEKRHEINKIICDAILKIEQEEREILEE